jgi:hypothetical protein
LDQLGLLVALEVQDQVVHEVNPVHLVCLEVQVHKETKVYKELKDLMASEGHLDL